VSGVDALLLHEDPAQVLERHDWPPIDQHFDDRRLAPTERLPLLRMPRLRVDMTIATRMSTVTGRPEIRRRAAYTSADFPSIFAAASIEVTEKPAGISPLREACLQLCFGDKTPSGGWTEAPCRAPEPTHTTDLRGGGLPS